MCQYPRVRKKHVYNRPTAYCMTNICLIWVRYSFRKISFCPDSVMKVESYVSGGHFVLPERCAILEYCRGTILFTFSHNSDSFKHHYFQTTFYTSSNKSKTCLRHYEARSSSAILPLIVRESLYLCRQKILSTPVGPLKKR